MEKTEKKRIDWIDTLRGLAMFFVVWGHCLKPNTFLRKYIYAFHMPLFFFISGLTFGESDQMLFKDFFKKKVKSLLLPYLVINIVGLTIQFIFIKLGVVKEFGLIDGILGILYSNSRVLPMGCRFAWFLPTLFLVEIIFYFLKKNAKSDFELGIACSICGIASYSNSISKWQIYGPWHVEAALMGVMIIYLGYIFMKNINKMDFLFNDKLRMLNWGFVFILIGLVIQYINRNVDMDKNLYGSITLFFSCCLSTICGLLSFVNLFLKRSKILNNIGKNTIFYLGYQLPLITIINHFFPEKFDSNVWVLLIAFALTMIMYPFSILVKNHFPFLIGKINIKALN